MAIATPVIAIMFILGTSSVLALVPVDHIDLIVQVESRLWFAFKLGGLIAATNAAGYGIFRRARSRRDMRLPLA